MLSGRRHTSQKNGGGGGKRVYLQEGGLSANRNDAIRKGSN